METRIIARVNNVDIVSTSDEQLVPIRPICEALGIDANGQKQRIERDEILGGNRVCHTRSCRRRKREGNDGHPLHVRLRLAIFYRHIQGVRRSQTVRHPVQAGVLPCPLRALHRAADFSEGEAAGHRGQVVRVPGLPAAVPRCTEADE